MGMAPTTSTTMALALGDALAVAVLERKDFAAADFQELHPGGSLGKRIMTVTDLMHAGDQMPLVTPDQTMGQAILVMTAKTFGCVGVVDDEGHLAGIVTDGDLRRHMDTLMQATAGDIAGQNPVTVTPDMFAAEALNIMNTKKISVLLAVDQNNMPIGILHIHDLLRAGVA